MPSWRSDGELREARAFKEAAAALRLAGAGVAAAAPAGAVSDASDWRLSRFYMWAQTARHLFVAVHVPTGFADRALRWAATPQGLKVQAEDSLPVVDRAWAGAVAEGAPVDALRSDDNRMLALRLRKAAPGAWRAAFAGDSDGARCLRPPYALAEADDDVLLEWPLPAGTRAADVAVDIGERGIAVAVAGGPCLRRTFWADSDPTRQRPAVEPAACAWTLRDGDDGGEADAGPLLSLLLAKPAKNEAELRYRSGRRWDNRAAEPAGHPGRVGARFFEDDADPFGLEDVLQALCFADEGETFMPPKPHRHYAPPHEQPRTARREDQLSEEARRHLALIRDAWREE